LRKNQNLNFEAYQKVFFRQTSISKVFFRKSYITNRLEGFLLYRSSRSKCAKRRSRGARTLLLLEEQRIISVCNR
jgi:hypothetical protein